jgi:hypothetical protein
MHTPPPSRFQQCLYTKSDGPFKRGCLAVTEWNFGTLKEIDLLIIPKSFDSYGTWGPVYGVRAPDHSI